MLVRGRFLRKNYKDPVTKNGEWRIIRQGEQVGPGIPAPGTSTGSGLTTTTTTTTLPRQPGSTIGGTLGGFVGVASTSKQKSLRVLNGQKSYDKWLFIAGQPRIIGKMRSVRGGIPGLPVPSAAPSPLRQP
jgi:hypothetical protein